MPEVDSRGLPLTSDHGPLADAGGSDAFARRGARSVWLALVHSANTAGLSLSVMVGKPPLVGERLKVFTSRSLREIGE